MRHYIGIDSSTTATKALVIDQDGAVIGVASSTYEYETPHPLWSEQDPALWWTATAEAIQQVVAETGISPTSVRGIGLTGQMHGLVLLDETKKVLRPAILWNDQRTLAECDEMRARVGKSRLIEITGNDALTGFTAPKLLWVRNHEPDLFEKIATVLLPKDYIRFKLTGDLAVDRAGGAGTQLFDIGSRSWSGELLKTLDLDASIFPPTYEGTQVTGLLTPAAAAETGLMPGIPVVGGGGDQAANAVGTGAVVDGVMTLSLGTSGVVFASSDKPIIDPEGRLHAFCHAVPGKWHMMGVMLSAAGSMRWHHDVHAPQSDYATFTTPAEAIPAGSNGLLFLPYLTGERTPYPDPLARGAFVGLTVRHTQAHMTRAVMEGVAYGLRDSFELMRSSGLAGINEVRVSGGGTQNRVWRQILADVFQTDMVSINTAEGAAFGAALLAAVGVGQWSTVEMACEAVIHETDRSRPSGNAAAYERGYQLYSALYPALQETFVGLSELDQ